MDIFRLKEKLRNAKFELSQRSLKNDSNNKIKKQLLKRLIKDLESILYKH
jgi:hypothetical protein